MEIIFNKALAYLILAVFLLIFAYFAWRIAYNNSNNEKYKSVLLKGFLWCTVIALFASFTLGNPSCEEPLVYDSLGSYCEGNNYSEGWEPTTGQKSQTFIFVMTLLYIPVIFGALNNRKKTTPRSKKFAIDEDENFLQK